MSVEKVSVKDEGRQCGRVKGRKIKGKGKEETIRTERKMIQRWVQRKE